MSTSVLLTAQHISHHFQRDRRQPPLPVLDNINLHLTRGTFTCLIGPSGCGKSTLLRLAAGLIKPTTGTLIFDGQPLTSPQRRISFVFQRDTLLPWRTVYDNIALPLQLAAIPIAEQQARITHWLTITGLNGFERAYPAELSGGMAQRVALARGLVMQPDLLLLDEPFGALDALTREHMWQELLKIWAQTQSRVLMVTHSIREALLLADRVVVMSPRPGHIVRQFEVPFARPRALELITEAEFTALEAQVRAAISF